MRSLPRLALIALAGLLIGVAAGCHKPASFTSRSYYVGSASRDKAVLLGCANGDKQGRATLFFGAPTQRGSRYGATLWGAPNQTTIEVHHLVQDFVRGYVWCRESSKYRLHIGIGTSNSGIDGRSDAWLRAHGRAWSTMVRKVADWANASYPGAVRIYGAWDAEPSWSTYGKAENWMRGYDNDNPGHRPLFANFSADGCPTSTATNGSCNNGWNQQRVWHLAWDHDPSMPFPQIYATSGANARQWQKIDEWAARNRSDGMYFYGVMAQAAACRQTGSACTGTDNTPHEAYDFMIDALATSSLTKQDAIWAMTDMHWHS